MPAARPSTPLIVDTNFYIRAIRDKAFGRRFTGWHDAHLPTLAMSVVVWHELLVGATDPAVRHVLNTTYIQAFRARGRLLVPSVATWEHAAEADAKLRKQGGYAELLAQRGFANDLLIALTAREIGATVLTENARDFSIIQSVTGVRHTDVLPASV